MGAAAAAAKGCCWCGCYNHSLELEMGKLITKSVNRVNDLPFDKKIHK